MKKALLDTSIIIDFIRSKAKEQTTLYKLAEKKYSLFVSIISHTELYAGKSVWEKPNALEELKIVFDGLSIVPLTISISKQAGKLRALNSLPTIDALIAATALAENLPLVTLNVKDFRKVRSLKLL